jgi:pyruvate kinase
VFTSNKRILTQLSLLWELDSPYDKDESTDRTVTDINDIAKKEAM